MKTLSLSARLFSLVTVVGCLAFATGCAADTTDSDDPTSTAKPPKEVGEGSVRLMRMNSGDGTGDGNEKTCPDGSKIPAELKCFPSE